jgi:tRNA(Arg) A34 adenosine deaminase TadA
MKFPEVILRLPDWVDEFVADETYAKPEDRMRLAVDLSREIVRRETGGPFGAAIFERDSGRLVSVGVNLVVGGGCSVFHGEMVAIMIAQRSLGDFDLGGPNHPAHELVTSTEPCAMCLGATPWSGVRHLACAARDEDARTVGFDEGSKVQDWTQKLEERGITVTRDVLRDEAVAVLQEYAALGGEIYNSRGVDDGGVP